MTVTYSLMTFWITTMLALLYGLLGEFSLGVLMLRIEETAIGAVIGIAVASWCCRRIPDRHPQRHQDVPGQLVRLIEISIATMFGGGETTSPTEQARQLDRNLQQFRVTAKPLLSGVAGLGSRRSIRRGLGIFTACDRLRANPGPQQRALPGPRRVAPLSDAFSSAAAQTRHNIDALIAIVDGAYDVTVDSATDDLDSSECPLAITAARANRTSTPDDSSPRCMRFARIERSGVTAAINLGARDAVKVSSPAAS